MVGAEGFEPPTLCSQSRCATRLRYAPTYCFDCSANWIFVALLRLCRQSGSTIYVPSLERYKVTFS